MTAREWLFFVAFSMITFGTALLIELHRPAVLLPGLGIWLVSSGVAMMLLYARRRPAPPAREGGTVKRARWRRPRTFAEYMATPAKIGQRDRMLAMCDRYLRREP